MKKNFIKDNANLFAFLFCVMGGVCLGYHNTTNKQIETIKNLKEQQAQSVNENLDLLAENEDLKEEVSTLNKQIEQLEKELAELPK